MNIPIRLVIKEFASNLIYTMYYNAYDTVLCRILALEKLGAVFNQVSTPLQFTPRRFVMHTESGNLILIETDHNAYTDETKQQRKQQMAEVGTQHTNA